MNLKNAKESKSQNLLSSRHANFLNIKLYEIGTLIYLIYWTRRVIPVSKIYLWNMVQWRFYYLLLFLLLLYSFLVFSCYISLVLQFCSILHFSTFRKQVWQNNMKNTDSRGDNTNKWHISKIEDLIGRAKRMNHRLKQLGGRLL